MPDLRQQLQATLRGRVCLMGLGNLEHGDDGFGVRLAENLATEQSRDRERAMALQFALPTSDDQAAELLCEPWEGDGSSPTSGDRLSPPRAWSVIVAGTAPERFLGHVASAGFNHVVFLDAVDFDGVPGSVVFLNSSEMAARFPQVSTHKLSLGLLAKWIEANGTTQAWLLGVQPQSLKAAHQLSRALEETLEILMELLGELRSKKALQCNALESSGAAKTLCPPPSALERRPQQVPRTRDADEDDGVGDFAVPSLVEVNR